MPGDTKAVMTPPDRAFHYHPYRPDRKQYRLPKSAHGRG
jgi:hypothetical protein